MLKRLARHFWTRVQNTAPPAKPYPAYLPAFVQPAKGSALLSYIAEPVLWPELHQGMRTHSRMWECREIGRQLAALGYDVDAVDWTDKTFMPKKKYDLIIDIDANLQRLAPILPVHTIRLLHLTGSYGPYQNQAELSRVSDFEEKTGLLYSPKRLVANVELAERSLRLSHACSLLGNDFTLQTYPEKYRNKITKIPVTGSALSLIKTEEGVSMAKPAFLWHFGAGAVHKGLDLVLDVFQKHPEWELFVAGYAHQEPDFRVAYEAVLALPNIHPLGPICPGDESFSNAVKKAFCVIAPSCSEGMSPAVVTCIQAGLFPIISPQTGVDLPEGCGLYIPELSSAAIENCIVQVLSMRHNKVVRQTITCQSHALKHCSREAFSCAIQAYLRDVLQQYDQPGGAELA